MKKHRILFQLLSLLIANYTFAETGERNLIVLLKSGTMISLPVSERPKIEFNGTVMRVGDGDYQVENVRKWMVGNLEEMVENNVGDIQSKNRIVYQDGMLTVGNRTDVHVYNAAGMEMPVQLKNGQVNLSAWPQDVYVVKIGTETFKIRKP
jgi:hypothetical protein